MDAKSVVRSLRARRDLERLGETPLADLTIVATRQRLRRHPATSAGRGLALRQVLLAAIDALKPATTEPDPTAPAWYAYLIVTRQYVAGEPVEIVRQALSDSPDGLPLRTYHRYRGRALDELGHILMEWELEASSGAGFVSDHPAR